MCLHYKHEPADGAQSAVARLLRCHTCTTHTLQKLTVAQLVETLRYKPEGWGQWNFSLT
jgi:hypothetical protein